MAFIAALTVAVWKIGQFVGRFEVRLGMVESMLKEYLGKVDEVLQRVSKLEGKQENGWPPRGGAG